MIKNPLFILLLSLPFVGCRQPEQKADNKPDRVDFPHLIKVHLTGEVSLPDSSKVYINTDENTMQPLLMGQVLNNTFVLDGELDEPNFYNLVVGKEKFKVYLENDKHYKFVAQVANGKVQNGKFTSDSKPMLDYIQMINDLDEKRRSLRQQQNSLRGSLDNPATYQAAVEKSATLAAEADKLPDQLKLRYITNPNIHPALKLFLIKDEKISRANYETYHKILTETPDSLKGLLLFRQAETTVGQVRDFFENMPEFPNIHPRNVEGDSLNVTNFKTEEVLLFVFWGSWNRESKGDIQHIKSNKAGLAKLGVTPIFLTWEKDFDAWAKASKTLGLGPYNYRLNAMDQDFMVNNYAVRQLPHYMLVNAHDLSLINHHFTLPLDGNILRKLQKELQK